MIQNDDEPGDPQLGYRNLIFSALQTEFGLMRGEIGRLIDHEKDLNQMSVVTLAAVFAFIGVFLDTKNKAAIAPVLLLIPFASLILTLTAQHLSRQILQIARYLKEIASIADYVLQPMLRQVFTTQQRQDHIVWTWEPWKRSDYKQRDPMTRFSYWLLEKARWLSLLLPGIVSLGVFAIMHSDFPTVPWYLFWMSLAVLLLSVLVVARYTEVSGVKEDGHDFVPFSSRDAAADITGQARIVTALATTGALDPGLHTSEATDIAYALLSPEVHRILATERGWPADRYERWITCSLPALLRAGQRPPPGPDGRSAAPEPGNLGPP